MKGSDTGVVFSRRRQSFNKIYLVGYSSFTGSSRDFEIFAINKQQKSFVNPQFDIFEGNNNCHITVCTALITCKINLH